MSNKYEATFHPGDGPTDWEAKYRALREGLVPLIGGGFAGTTAEVNGRWREAVRALLAPSPAEGTGEADDLAGAIRTLLPGLRVANYVERWSPASPAVKALGILCRFVGEDVPEAGDLIDPDVPTSHALRPEGAPTPVSSGEAGSPKCVDPECEQPAVPGRLIDLCQPHMDEYRAWIAAGRPTSPTPGGES